MVSPSPGVLEIESFFKVSIPLFLDLEKKKPPGKVRDMSVVSIDAHQAHQASELGSLAAIRGAQDLASEFQYFCRLSHATPSLGEQKRWRNL